MRRAPGGFGGFNEPAALTLERVTKTYAGVTAVDDVSLEVRAGEFVTLLGPSGSGKTTTLRIVAGLVRADAGRIVARGNDITNMPAYRRDIGIVFQNYALFPHMTAAQNIAFPLKVRGVTSTEIDSRVQAVLHLVRLSGLGDRFPRQLSGGQQQRVALARAIVFRPWLLLMDEPLGALDKKLREAMQLEIARISREVGVTVLYVTHDQEEALAMSDRIAIFRHGRVEQVGTGEELYEQPASLFVGQFMGESTVLRGVLQTASGDCVVAGARWRIRVAPEACRRVGVRSGSRVAVVVRPERLRIGPAPGRSDPGGRFNCVSGTVLEQMYLGSVRKYVIDLGDGDQAIVRAQVGTEPPTAPVRGSVQISWDLSHGVVVADDREVEPAVHAQDARSAQTEATGAGRVVGAP